MENVYDDGLDDFDRDLLGHAPLRPQQRPINKISSRQQTPGYFPTSAPSHRLNSFDEYGPYYEATLLPSPHLEPQPPRGAMMTEDVHHISNTTDVFRPESVHLSGDSGSKWQTGQPLLRAGLYPRSSEAGRPITANLHDLGSSSPTARVSARKRRDSQAFPAAPNPSDSSSMIRFISPHQPNPQPATPVVHGIPLVSLRQALPDKFRAIFPYELFNAVQSKLFDVVYGTDDNVVVAAPTGSGKTVILELAICRLALNRGNENFKIVYQAPTKALCSEKARDWGKKFSHMNLKCAELTGDTSRAEMRRVGEASIIITTPEKWDSITRKWQDHRRLLQMVELFLIDEVHILKDVRGATLETVVSRMKTIGANVRFVALSATVPNSDDIAVWLGRNHTNQQLPAHREVFGEEFRPVKLQKFVYGFDSNSNDYIFDKFLDQKLPSLLSRHARQKPILVFCFTRKSCESTAAMLADFASGLPDGDKLWPVPSQRVPVVSSELQEIVKFGVAFHHAGLDAEDRSSVEQHFLKGQLGVICCTSTLAVGVNLPCHTVVLKGTVGFTDEKLAEYSDLEVMQMLGRAGRPQFDDSATAIILTRTAHEERYQKMVSGKEILESTLHLNLIEHLNSEVCLGTIHDLPSAKTWLGGTFLSVRLRRNPSYYRLTGGTTNSSWLDDRLGEICERDIKQLQEAELVTDQGTIRCTEYGRAMSKYMVEFNTMKLILQIPRGVGMEVLITMLSQASEFKEFRFKQAERSLFREINQSPLILYPVREMVNQTGHKISLMIQAHLGSVQYSDSRDAAKLRRQLMMERKMIFERLNRLVRAVIDCKGHDCDSVGTKTALELARALAAEFWEGRATQLTQVPNIGPVGMRKLASKDIRTVLQLADKDYDEIERLMSRQPPFGRNLQVHLDKFPRLGLEVGVVGHKVQPTSNEPVLIEVKATLRYLNRKGPPNWLGRIPALTFLAENGNGTLVYFWRGSMKKLDRQAGLELKFFVGLRDAQDHIDCHFTCEEIVGTIVSTTLKPKLPASVFPSRPAMEITTSLQNRRASSQEYLDDDGIDDSDLILAAEQALTEPPLKTQTATAPNDPEGYPSVEALVELDSMERQAVSGHSNYMSGHDDGDETEPQESLCEPVRLPNGKWRCNHACSGGAPTRSGKPCSHRCCKEGLDKPRKRPLQRPKRKREEPGNGSVDERPSKPTPVLPQRQPHGVTQALVGASGKRQKVQSVLTPSTFAPLSSGLANSPQSHWKSVDINAMNLECIDLSFTDDDDEIFNSVGNAPCVKAAAATSDTASINKGTAKEKPENGASQGATAVPNHPRKHTSSQGIDKPSAVSSTQQTDYFDDFIDDDAFAILEGTHSSHRQIASVTATTAFKSGASDEVLYQGISKGFDESRATSSLCYGTSMDATVTLGRRGKTYKLDSSRPVDRVPEMSPDTSPGSAASAELAMSPAGVAEVTTSGVGESSRKPPFKGNNEPAWVSEFDPEFVEMFRGFVTFV